VLDYLAERPARIGICAAVRPVRLPFGELAAHTVLAEYVSAVSASGAVPLLLPCVAGTQVDALLDAVDALILTGGPDLGADPGRDEFESQVLRAVLERRTPTLAVCRGLQLINVQRGGTLRQHVDGHLGESVRHPIDIAAGSELATAVGTGRLETGSLHHQAVDELGTGLQITARADDGTVEALEAPGFLAVQWHPELEPGAAGTGLFRWLAAKARERQWT
jgi:putative glutamine amidotransferase